MPEYGAWPIWEDEAVGNVNPDSLPVSAELRARLLRWAGDYDSTLDPDDPSDSGFPSDGVAEAHDREGRELSRALAEELGAGYSVRYWRDHS